MLFRGLASIRAMTYKVVGLFMNEIRAGYQDVTRLVDRMKAEQSLLQWNHFIGDRDLNNLGRHATYNLNCSSIAIFIGNTI